jgi:hypothetical protein
MQRIFAGLSDVTLPESRSPLGEDAELERIYGYLISPKLLAYAPAPPGQHNPAPWSAVDGGDGIEFHVQLMVQNAESDEAARDSVWCIAALFRLAKYPFLLAPVIADQPLVAPSTSSANGTPVIRTFETQRRIFTSPTGKVVCMSREDIDWVGRHWRRCQALFKGHPKFAAVFRAFDMATVSGRSVPSLLPIWTGLETLFSFSRGEVRFRSAAFISTYLEPPGPTRLELYRRILKLYNERSAAAHGPEKVDLGSLTESYVLLRNALVKIVDSGNLPTQDALEKDLFEPSAS